MSNSTPSPKRPNILVIHADEHRYDCIGAYGNREIRTPNIDGLAADGILYRNSFCSYPVCTPSRYSLLTGLYVRQHIGWSNHCTLPSGLKTFPRILKKAGYRTQAVGKMHFTPTYLDVGFDTMLLAEQNGVGRYEDDYHRYLRERGLVDRTDLEDQEKEYRDRAAPEYWESFGAVPSGLAEKDYSTTWIADRAMEALDRWTGGGNLLMVGFIKPHHPFDPPHPWCDLYDPDRLKLLDGWTGECLPADESYHLGYFRNSELTERTMKRIMSYYYASISQIDFQVGRLVKRLKEKGLYDHTAVFYTSDHGDYMGYHHMILKSNHMYDPLVRVPLIVKYPKGLQAGRAACSLVSNVDIAATILEMAGLEPEEDMSPCSLLNGDPVRQAVFAEDRGETMVRTRSRKFLYSNAEDRRCMYFDLQKDPYELENLYPDRVDDGEIVEMKKRLLEWSFREAKIPLHCDETADCVAGADGPGPDRGKWKESAEYFKEKMDSSGAKE